MISCTKVSDTAMIPERHSKEAAGCDIYSYEPGVIEPKQKKVVRTGIVLNVPNNHVAMIYGRSGLSNKYLLEVVNNCIYPGDNKELLLYFYNNGNSAFEYAKNERIAQVVFCEVNSEMQLQYM